MTAVPRNWESTLSSIDPPPPYRPLGAGGPPVSSIGWGMWRFAGVSPNQARRLIEAALDAGITLFDTADIYGVDGPGFGEAEALLGTVLADAPHLRDRMVIATKGGIVPGVPCDSSADYLASAIEASLGRLRVEQVPLWQVHRPDLLAHPAEIARAVEAAHAAGKIGAVGVSNFTAAQTRALAAHLSLPIVSHQPEFSPFQLDPLDDGVLDQAIERNMAVLAWSPLGGGRIAEPGDARDTAVVAALDAKAVEAGVGREAAALSWIMAHPARPIPIIGSQRPERIAAAPDAYLPRWSRTEWYDVLRAGGRHLP